jgi:hypothetical protein
VSADYHRKMSGNPIRKKKTKKLEDQHSTLLSTVDAGSVQVCGTGKFEDGSGSDIYQWFRSRFWFWVIYSSTHIHIRICVRICKRIHIHILILKHIHTYTVHIDIRLRIRICVRIRNRMRI